MRNYSFEEGIVIAKEMTDVLSLDLVEKGLATSSVTLWIAYDHRFGREPTRGSAKFPDPTNSSKKADRGSRTDLSGDDRPPYRDTQG